MMRYLIISLCFLLVSSWNNSWNIINVVMGAEKKKAIHDQITGQGYGMAGCGLGSVIFGENENKWAQVIAVTTNNTSGSNTFGVSSGTSNCNTDEAQTSSTRKNTEIFIAANQMALFNDAARSGGESIEALSIILKCDRNGTEELARTLQKNYREIFVKSNGDMESSAPVITDNIFKNLNSNPDFYNNCKNKI
ncbi:MAG: DUF3015 family protein [Oligoflexia bacterium]|nr:DUF3015 family protein [Oligoflexia bacterium]